MIPSTDPGLLFDSVIYSFFLYGDSTRNERLTTRKICLRLSYRVYRANETFLSLSIASERLRIPARATFRYHKKRRRSHTPGMPEIHGPASAYICATKTDRLDVWHFIDAEQMQRGNVMNVSTARSLFSNVCAMEEIRTPLPTWALFRSSAPAPLTTAFFSRCPRGDSNSYVLANAST